MSKHLKAFLIKLLFVSILVFSIYSLFFQATYTYLLVVTVIVAALTYLVDLFVLPHVHPVSAAIIDFASYSILFTLFGALFIEGFVPTLMAGLGIAYFAVLSEILYHMYIMDQIHERDRGMPLPTRFQTEASEEINNEVLLKKEEEKKE